MKPEEKGTEPFKNNLLVTEHKRVGEVRWAAINSRFGSLYQPNTSGFTDFLGFMVDARILFPKNNEEIQYFIKKTNKTKTTKTPQIL
jgi:hypothetical protein